MIELPPAHRSDLKLMAHTSALNLPDHLLPLLDPSTYPHPTKEIAVIQTHISWVFLTGTYAYKVKKPVNFGFLDFSTPAKRSRASIDELRLNRRLAPDLYLDVLYIYKEGGHYQLGTGLNAQDQFIDCALKMIQFDQHDLFDRRLSEHTFNPEWMDQLAAGVADFHLHAETNSYINSFGRPEFLIHHMLENLDMALGSLPLGKSTSDLQHLREMSNRHFTLLKGKLENRQQLGHIRDCHGDLHLKNITLFNETPTIFDCIEFSDELRMIDTMNDAAFMVMDCDSIGRSDLGYRFLSRYLERCGDYEGLELLSLFLSYRAGVRGKVACLFARELIENNESTPKEIESTHLQATHYFTMAEQYLSKQKSPELIIIGGLSGSGKSHLALLALEHIKAVIIRSDATRKRIANDHADLALYGNEMHELTYQAMFDAAEKTLSAGISVILDATFLHPASREKVKRLAARVNVPFLFYWLDINNDTLRTRVKERSREGTDLSDADPEVLEQQISHYERPDESYIRYIDNSSHWPPAETTATTG